MDTRTRERVEKIPLEKWLRWLHNHGLEIDDIDVVKSVKNDWNGHKVIGFAPPYRVEELVENLCVEFNLPIATLLWELEDHKCVDCKKRHEEVRANSVILFDDDCPWQVLLYNVNFYYEFDLDIGDLRPPRGSDCFVEKEANNVSS